MTIFNCKAVYLSLFMLFTGKAGVGEISGPVGMIGFIGETSKAGIVTLLSLVGLLTVNLGIMNLLPIPALDGGRLVFLFIEAIRHKPIKPEREGMVHAIGFIILILFIVIISINDIIKIFT